MENRNASIKLDELRATINEIFDHLTKDLGLSEIELTENFYQEIPVDALYDAGQDSVEPTVGSLFDDLDFLASVQGNRQNAVSLMLVHVAPLLQFIAHKVGQ